MDNYFDAWNYQVVSLDLKIETLVKQAKVPYQVQVNIFSEQKAEDLTNILAELMNKENVEVLDVTVGNYQFFGAYEGETHFEDIDDFVAAVVYNSPRHERGQLIIIPRLSEKIVEEAKKRLNTNSYKT